MPSKPYSEDDYSGRVSLIASDKEVDVDRAAKFENQGEIQYPFEDTTGVGDENKIRGNWTSPADFFTLSLGFSVGLNNFWRIPFYFSKYGKSAFLLPYITMLIVIGVPIYFLEFSLGQFSSVGCVTCWKLCPLFKGIGVASLIVASIISIYYNAIIAWFIFYLINSLRFNVPWASCSSVSTALWDDVDFNCTVRSRSLSQLCCAWNGTLFPNGSCVIFDAVGLFAKVLDHTSDYTIGRDFDATRDYCSSYFKHHPDRQKLAFLDESSSLVAESFSWPSGQYFQKLTLKLSKGLLDVDTIHWHLVLYSFLAWVLVFFSLFKGVKSAGKVAYVTTILPYIILFVFFVRALFYERSLEFIVDFLQPDWTGLLDFKAWCDAGVHAFYSLSCCCGGLITLASFNKFHANSYKQTWILCFGDVLSSIFFGVVVFATMGSIADDLFVSNSANLVQKDYGVAFILFSEAISRSSVAPIWAVLFFLMLIMLGIDSQIVLVDTVVTALCDEFPEYFRKFRRHVLCICAIFFYALGVPFCTSAGLYYIILFDSYFASWSLLILAFFEVTVLAWVYGVDTLMDDIKWMIGYYPSPYLLWKILWMFVTPVVIFLMLVYSWLYFERLSYNDYLFPDWAHDLGWALSFLSIAAIPLVACFKFFTRKGSCSQRFRSLLTPEDDWGPALAVYRAQQYPLQAPESKDPMRVPWIVKKHFRPKTPTSHVTLPPCSFLDRYHDESSLNPLTVPDSTVFDRETII